MYELNGQQYSLEEIQAAADQSNLSLQDYIARANIKMINTAEQDFQTPTTPGAVVEETVAPDMDSSSVDISSDLQKKAIGSALKNIQLPGVGGMGTGVRLSSAFARMYNDTAEYLKGVAETKLRTATDLIQVFRPDFTEDQQNQVIDIISDQVFQPIVDTVGGGKIAKELSFAKEAVDVASYEDVERTAYEEFFSDEGNAADGIKKILNGVVEATPSVLAALSGPVGYAALFGSAAGDAYKRKVEAGAQKGDLEAFTMSVAQGGVELASEMVTRGILKGFGGTVASKLAPQTAKNVYKNLTKTLTGRVFTGATLEGVSEVGAQETNRFIDAMWDDENVFGYRKDETYESGDFKYDWGNIAQRSFDTFMISAIIGGGLGSASKTDAAKSYVNERLSPTLMKKENLLLTKQIGKLEAQYQKAPNPIIETQIFKLKKQILDNKKINERTLELFDDNELAQYAAGKVAVSQAKEGLKDITDPETKKLIENSIQDQESALDEIFNAKKNQVIEGDVKKSTEFAESAESIGLETKAFKSTQDFEAGIEADGIKLNDEQRSELGEVGGFISGNKIYINEQVAAETGNLNVGGHEVMHGVVTEKLKELDSEQLNKLQNDFLELLPPTERQLLQDALNKRYDTKDHAKEFFSVFSDLSKDGDIKYNETLYTKIRDWLVEMIRRFTPYKKIEFNNAQDVYTFMREYTNSINKGRLSKGLAKGIGKVGPAEAALSKQASDNVQNIYNEKGIDGSFDIIEAFNPIINKLVDKRREAPNFSREDLTSEIKYSDRGILGLIRSYDPNSGVPLAAYVNKFLPSRMIEASNKILGEEFTVDVTEARGVVAQETETITEKPVTKKIKPSSLLKDIEAAKSKIMQGLKNVPEKDLTFKRLKDLSPETTAEIFEVPVKKVIDPKANLNKGDLSNAARNINKNADKLLRLLPKGAVVEAASEKLLGTSTGVPKSLLDVFYTKQERLTRGAGLSPYKLNSINRQQFLEGLGIVDGKLREGLSPRSPEAQRIKAIMNLTGKLITNEIVRSETDLSPEQKQNVAAGKADIMFSKSERQNNTSELVQKAIEGKSDLVQSKILENNQLNNLIKKYNGNIELLRKNNPKQAAKLDALVENLIIAQNGIDNIVNYVKDFQSQTSKEFKDLDLTNIQSNKYKKIDVDKAIEFSENSKELLEYLPEWMKENKTLAMGLLTLHYRTNMEGISLEKVKEKTNLDGENFTEVPGFAKTWNPDSVGTKSEGFWDDISKSDISSISVLKGAYNKAHKLYEQGKNAEADAIISNAYSKIGNDVKKRMIDAWGNALEAWYKSSKNKTEKLKRAKHIMLMGRNNTNVEQGLRQLVPVEAIFTGKMKATDITKLEHASPMAKFSLEFSRSIVEGTWQKEKNNIINNYTGIVGPKRIFDVIDKLGKKTNPAGLVRMMFDPNTLKMFKTIDSGFKKSLYDKFTESKDNIQRKGQIVRQAREFLISEFKKADEANIQFSKKRSADADINKQFNKYLESATGIGAEKVFNQAKAVARGSRVRKSFGDYFIPPGAEDFGGLMHKTLAKGKKGEQQLEFYKKYLYDPYNAAMESITREKSAMMNDFMALKKQFSNVPKRLKKFTKGGDYTNDQAVRVYAWTRQGMEIPGLSKKDIRELVNEVKNDKELLAFATELINITKGDGYPKPEESWMGGNVAIDLMSLLNGDKRSKHLEAWQNNVDILFSKENMFKLEAAYGKNWVKNVKATLERMKNGSNRKWGGDKNLQAWNDWVNGSVGTIMFLNTRSAALQMISNVNYINYKDNNPLRAAQAFANQKQYWSDFVEIFNSDYLQERRGGNKININESELALAAEKGGVQGTISYLLNKGFILTKIADSFAIASGGATMYRNRIKTYVKDGMSEADAKKQAFLDFKAITEETQQSSRPDRISEQQAGNLGRFMLAFANTPMQYNRIIKRNAQDLIDGRGDPKEKLSKILYYSTIQNLIFNAMQKAVFALAFADDDDDEKIVSKAADVANGMGDSLLRGSGLAGNAIVAAKNVAMEIAKQSKKPNPKFEDVAWKALTVSPPLYGKVTRLRGAGYSMKYVTPENVFEPSLDNPALSAAAQTASATFNFPLDRALRKAQNIEAAMSDEAEWWQRAALFMGWGSWELGMENEKDKKEKSVRDTKRKTFDRAKSRKTIERTKRRKTF
jgi:hypothetical protein